MTYDDTNNFAKILRKEVPCNLVDENDSALAFYDIAPAAPIHILVIPKNKYTDFFKFMSEASSKEILEINELIKKIIKEKQLNENGFRIITNSGNDGNQEVKHLHFHILGGRNLGKMIN